MEGCVRKLTLKNCQVEQAGEVSYQALNAITSAMLNVKGRRFPQYQDSPSSVPQAFQRVPRRNPDSRKVWDWGHVAPSSFVTRCARVWCTGTVRTCLVQRQVSLCANVYVLSIVNVWRYMCTVATCYEPSAALVLYGHVLCPRALTRAGAGTVERPLCGTGHRPCLVNSP